MTISETEMNSITVITTLQAINEGVIDRIPVQQMKEGLGREYATMILNALPVEVGTFAHSQRKEIKVTRYQGETWDEVQAADWANSVSKDTSEQGREFSNR